MNEEKLRTAIAYDIRAELVCCRIYHDLEPMRKEIDKLEENEILPRFDLSVRLFEKIRSHEICYWAEAAALIAEEGNGTHN